MAHRPDIANNDLQPAVVEKVYQLEDLVESGELSAEVSVTAVIQHYQSGLLKDKPGYALFWNGLKAEWCPGFPRDPSAKSGKVAQ
jgi:hypothetical protein